MRRPTALHSFTSSLLPALAAVLTSAASARAECPGTWTIRDITSMAACSISFTLTGRPCMAFDRARGVSVYFGGTEEDSGCGTGANSFQTYEWNDTTWSRRATSGEPPSREDAAMAYDSTRHVCVMFGGSTSSSGLSNETWEWDGTLWHQRTSTPAPSARRRHDMVYDSARGVVVLFGGQPPLGGSPTLLGDTWEWDGTRWRQRTPATSPHGRYLHAMAYDSRRGVTVLFGGATANDQYNNETWEWDGNNWTMRSPAVSPLGRNNHTMAFDDVRGVSVLLAGATASSPSLQTTDIADLWEWDGAAWSNLAANGIAPNSGSGGRMVFDSARPGGGVMVEFGLTHAATSDNHPYLYELSVPSLSFTQQPVGMSVPIGQPASFTAAAAQGAGSGGPSGTIQYQWRKNGVPLGDVGGITGSATPTLSILTTSASSTGAYDCIATLGSCPVASNPAALVMTPACPEDLNSDGIVNTFDLAKLLAKFGVTCP